MERLAQLLALVEEDERVRTDLLDSGSLFGGYHPRMEAVHLANARALSTMIGEGWPTVAEVGEEGQRAAWVIAQHAISQPQFQRQCLALLETAVAQGDAPAWQMAMLSDRIRVLEGRPQRYGTQFDWDENGQISPLPIEEACGVEERRAQVGLEPLAEATARHRRNAQENGERPPADRAQHLAGADAWARRVGWRTR